MMVGEEEPRDLGNTGTLQITDGYPGMSPCLKRKYDEAWGEPDIRQAILDISLCKLRYTRPWPRRGGLRACEPSLRRSVLIFNTLRHIELELRREGVPMPPAATWGPPQEPLDTLDSPPQMDPTRCVGPPMDPAYLPDNGLARPCTPVPMNTDQSYLSPNLAGYRTPAQSYPSPSYDPQLAVSGADSSVLTCPSVYGSLGNPCSPTPPLTPGPPYVSAPASMLSSCDSKSTLSGETLYGLPTSNQLNGRVPPLELPMDTTPGPCRAMELPSYGLPPGPISSRLAPLANTDSLMSSDKQTSCSFTSLLDLDRSTVPAAGPHTASRVTVPCSSPRPPSPPTFTTLTTPASSASAHAASSTSATSLATSLSQDPFSEFDLSAYDLDLLKSFCPSVKMAPPSAEELMHSVEPLNVSRNSCNIRSEDIDHIMQVLVNI